MALRCLLFSSHEALVQPIWQVLAELGIEGEYCQSAVDAVERVTTQQFQIVITDWDDQPEAAFLLKTARDLKAAQRPLTLAIVSDDARLPEALRAGANSVLAKPIRPEQVRDTMSTACQLLKTKQQPGTAQPLSSPSASPQAAGQRTTIQQPAPAAVPWKPTGAGALAAAASAAAASVPTSVTQSPEKLRAGEFLQTPTSAPGGEFDTASEENSLEPAPAEVEALTELEPMASAVASPPEQEPKQEPLTGWASLQARLTKSPPPMAEDAPAKSELLSYSDTASKVVPAAPPPPEKRKQSAPQESQAQAESEAALFAYASGETKASGAPEPPRSKRLPIFLAAVLAIVCVLLEAAPRSRGGLRGLYLNTVRAGKGWLNPAPAAMPPPVSQHDSFGQSGDEYKLPTPVNIPDATTDPSQIRVLPVIDPTIKPKPNDTNGGQAQTPTIENATDPAQTAPAPAQGEPPLVEQKDPASTKTPEAPQTSPGAASDPAPAQTAPQQNVPAPQPAAPERPTAPTVRTSPPPQARQTPLTVLPGIPSSLRSQIATSITPESSGTKPPEAAMLSIEPVMLSEPATRELLAQALDPEYPAAAKSGAQHGSVTLQVLIGRDGVVQDAKFMQGSLVFARSAIDAVRQWRFKPYSMNGRAVSVQSVITLNFKPPA